MPDLYQSLSHSRWDRSSNPPSRELAEFRGKQIVFLKTLQNEDMVETLMEGFGDGPKDDQIRIENRKVGAGLLIKGDRPLSSLNLWSIWTVLAMEPFIAMSVAPGQDFTWRISYRYYSLPSNPR